MTQFDLLKQIADRLHRTGCGLRSGESGPHRKRVEGLLRRGLIAYGPQIGDIQTVVLTDLGRAALAAKQ